MVFKKTLRILHTYRLKMSIRNKDILLHSKAYNSLTHDKNGSGNSIPLGDDKDILIVGRRYEKSL